MTTFRGGSWAALAAIACIPAAGSEAMALEDRQTESATVGEKAMTIRDTAQEAHNKQLALDMWQAVIVDYDPEAVLRYISPDYIQHNPAVPPGRDFLYNAVKELRAERDAKPDAPVHTTKRLVEAVAEGDLVVLTWYVDVADPDDPAKTYVASSFDMFRFRDGMIVEHWDDIRKGVHH